MYDPGMADHKVPNVRSISTNWEWKKVKMRDPGPPQGSSAAQPLRPWGLRKRNRRKPIWISVKYQGGSDASYWVEFRGTAWRFPGHACLHDVMEIINAQAPWKPL